MQNNARHAYRTAKNNDKIHKYARKMHKNGGPISAFKARGDVRTFVPQEVTGIFAVFINWEVKQNRL